MITREAIENYAEIQGGRCLEVFSMRESLLDGKYKQNAAYSFLEQCIEFISAESKNMPLDKSRRIQHFLSSYDLDTAIIQWRLIAKKKADGLGWKALKLIMGDIPAKMLSYLTELELTGLTDEEKSEVVQGLMLTALWNEAK